MSERKIRRALVSVSDKSGLVEFAKALQGHGVELISTGGTRKALAEAGLKVRDISEVTGFPEILDGRVKTLHPRIHAGILAVRDQPQHEATLAEHDIAPIDLVVCNLYPFEATLARPDSSHEDIIENIDVGGPSMIRAAAKNYHGVAVVTEPAQYAAIIEELSKSDGALSLATRERLAGAAFARTAAYDQAISGYFASIRGADIPVCHDGPGNARQTGMSAPQGDGWPHDLHISMRRSMELRYGENPHQKAAFYVEPAVREACIATAEQLHGKELSYNNILDLDSGFNLVREFPQAAAVVIKHNNPCGAAIAASLAEAFRKAYEGDPLSAFGGVLAFNRPLDEATALLITEPNRFIECIIAPGYDEAALQVLTTRPTWKKNVRILRTGPLPAVGQTFLSAAADRNVCPTAARERLLDYRRVDGGLLVQTRDAASGDFAAARTVTARPPTDAEMRDLQFTWLVCKHVKSNAIVLGNEGMIVGVGAGQMSRVDSVHMAVRKAGERSRGSVLASDAFFPFRDNVDEAARAGITAIAQPGGSMRDQDSIDACNQHRLAMVFTGVRHFRH